ncbi:hypothetical protein Goshw_012084 [Gossypium schwendimanii]|uniref:NB-ARC domain-containing protein n=1 Tax=Gossypium schwendimanii TaxID=34291 RepID=A0A7J9KKR4_GOSSC|nr:hypothetical protein [Gossypium schwendimanii]
MNDLKRKAMELNGMKEDTDSRMSAELLPRKKLKREVQIWLENVERINGEAQSLDGQIGESSRFTRGFHADDVLKRIREVEELIQQGKFQDDMASKIGVSFCGDEDEITRAGMLFEALSRKRRSVIILDDLWQEVSLDKVGIPEPSTGSKLVLTTRAFDVCRKMSCRAIKVKPLVEEESWKLFPEKVGRGILNIPEVELIAEKIVERYWC